MLDYIDELSNLASNIRDVVEEFKDRLPADLRISLDLMASEIEAELPVD